MFYLFLKMNKKTRYIYKFKKYFLLFLAKNNNFLFKIYVKENYSLLLNLNFKFCVKK